MQQKQNTETKIENFNFASVACNACFGRCFGENTYRNFAQNLIMK